MPVGADTRCECNTTCSLMKAIPSFLPFCSVGELTVQGHLLQSGMFLQASLLRGHVYICWLATNHILPVYLCVLNQTGKFLSAVICDCLLKQDWSCVGLQWFLESEEMPMHSSEWVMSLQSALLFTAVLCSCVTDLHAMAVLIKLELSRSSRNIFHFLTHYVPVLPNRTLCKSCQSILLPSLLIRTVIYT